MGTVKMRQARTLLCSEERSSTPSSKLNKMLLYAITDRSLLGTAAVDDRQRMRRLIDLARTWARSGVDYLQVREKDLAPDALLLLTRAIVSAVRETSPECRTRVLLNVSDRRQAEVAEAGVADGIHIACDSPGRERLMAGLADDLVSIGCHSLAEVEAARAMQSDLVLFAPVFEKRLPPARATARGEDRLPGQGLPMLEACCAMAGSMPVFALGGVTTENAADCVASGAAGVAGIRLFLDERWPRLRHAGDRTSPG